MLWSTYGCLLSFDIQAWKFNIMTWKEFLIIDKVICLYLFFLLHFIYLLCVGVGMNACAEIRGQLAGTGSHLPPCRSCDLNSGHQAWWQVPLPAVPSCLAQIICFSSRNKNMYLIVILILIFFVWELQICMQCISFVILKGIYLKSIVKSLKHKCSEMT